MFSIVLGPFETGELFVNFKFAYLGITFFFFYQGIAY